MNPNLFKNMTAKQLADFDPQLIEKFEKMDLVLQLKEQRNKFPDYTKQQLCKSIGISDSYAKRMTKELGITKVCRNKKPTKKKGKKDKNENIEVKSNKPKKSYDDKAKDMIKN